MRTINKIKLKNIICIFCLATFCFPQMIFAQRFGHGGGGGGGNRGGGGGFGGGSRPAPPANRSFNGGGGRTVERHEVREPERHIENRQPERHVENRERDRVMMHNEGVYHHVYGDHPYSYHAYHPYVWGPRWHPYGYFVGALAADAFYFSMAGMGYWYDDGVYYMQSGNGYAVTTPPIGAVVGYLPDGYVTVQVGDAIYYYYGGVFYINQGNSFRVVPAPIGAIVYEIPEGATDQVISGQDYLLYNNTYYLPISQNGQDAYEVVQVN